MSKPLFTTFETGESGRVGYARCSTKGQNLRRQVKRLGTDGRCRRVYAEVVSGAQRERPALEELRAHVRPGDVVVVESLDRLGRGAAQVLELCEELLLNRVGVETLRENLTTTGAAGRMILPFVAAMAEAERTAIRERTRLGVEEARRRGRRIGRPRVVTVDRAKLAAALRAEGKSLGEIAVALKVSRSSVKRMLDGLQAQTKPAAQQSLPGTGEAQ